MAFVAGEVVARLGLDLSRFTSGLAQAKTGLENLKNKVNGFVGMALPSFTLMGLSKSMISDAMSYQGAVKSLSMNLAMAGNQTRGLTKDMMDFADQMMATYGVEDDMILKTAAMAAQYGVSGDKLKATMRAAIGMSKSFDMEVSTAMWHIVRGMNGMVMRNSPLRMLGLDMKTCKTEAERYAKIMEITDPLWKKVEASAGGLKTGMMRLSAAWGDVRKEMGLSIINGLQLAAVYNYLASRVMDLTEAWRKLSPVWKAVIVMGAAAVAAFTTLGMVVISAVYAIGAFLASMSYIIPVLSGIAAMIGSLIPVVLALSGVWIALGVDVATVGDLWNGATAYMGMNWQKCFKTVVDWVQYAWIYIKRLSSDVVVVFKGIVDGLGWLATAFVTFFFKLGSLAGETLMAMGELFADFFNNPLDMKTNLSDFKDNMKQAGSGFWESMKSQASNFGSILSKTLDGLNKNESDFASEALKVAIGAGWSQGLMATIDGILRSFKKSWKVENDVGSPKPMKDADSYTTVQAKLSGAYEKGSKEAYSVEKNSQYTALSKIESNTSKTALVSSEISANTARGNNMLATAVDALRDMVSGGGLDIPIGAAQ